MSTFGGKLKEIPDISVDRFDGDNLDSLAYFLSHCHTDHMVGLSTNIFQNGILEGHKFIYTSDVSSVILKTMFPLIKNNITILDIYKPTIIMLRDKAISVTPIPAGHCPGSVMFLFENDTLLILYTGDYRIHKHDVRKVKSFYNSMNEVKDIEKIYLDTTFFLKSYLSFPKREDSLNEIIKVIKEWIVKSSNHVIQLLISAKYGYEYVFNEIYRKIGMPVHVNYNVYDIYSIIPEMDHSVTLDDTITQIHSNCGYRFQSMCLESNGKEIKKIKVSAFRWTQDNLESGLSSFEYDTHYICYSTHASYEEGVELIKFLKPKSIEACVKHDDPYTNVEMMQLLDKCLIEFKKEEKKDDRPKMFTINSASILKDDSDSNLSPLDNDILSSPPRENKADMRRFLRKHSSSFVLDDKYESLKIEEEEKAIQEEFIFEQEFGIEEPCSSKRTVTGVSKYSQELIKLCEVKTQENRNEKHTPNAENTLESEQDDFTEWLNASPDINKVKQYSNRILNTNVVDDVENCELAVHSSSSNNASSHIISNNVEDNFGSDTTKSNSLQELYFLDPAPPKNEKTGITNTNRKDESNNDEGCDDGIVSDWIFDLISSRNPTEDKLNLGGMTTTNVHEVQDECCTLELDKPSEKNVENHFLIDTFNTSGIDKNLSLNSRSENVENCPPRKKPR